MSVNTITYEGEPVKSLGRMSWLRTRTQENLFPHLREFLDNLFTEKQKDLIMILEVLK
jgi:hypothetical protein